MGIAAGFAGCEGGCCGAGIVRLSGALLRVRTKHLGQARPRLRFTDRMCRRRRQRRGVLPLRQTFPHTQPIVRRRRIRSAERGGDEWRPAPSSLAHARRQPGGIAVQRDLATQRQPVQQGGREFRQQRCLRLQPAGRRFEIQHQGETAGRGRGGAPGQRKCEQLQQVERRRGADTESAECRGSVHQNRRRQAAQPAGRVRRGQQQQLAIGGEDGGAAVPGYDGRRVWQRNACHGSWLTRVTRDP